VSAKEIAEDYDAALVKLWGGPPPKHFPAAYEEWPARYPSGRGKVALVTGGGGGIGFYVSKLLVRLGYTVIIPARGVMVPTTGITAMPAPPIEPTRALDSRRRASRAALTVS
jgi:hypothetical protein